MAANESWRPTARLERLQERARILAEVRAFFSARGVLEVETPCLSAAALTSPHIESFSTPAPGFGPAGRLYLHTSPEFPMKRLLAAGYGPIYQLARVFRQGERGRRHNPEFTLLEWYRPGYSMARLIAEVAALAAPLLGLPPLGHRCITYQAAFLRWVGIDPLQATVAELQGCARGLGLDGAYLEADDRDGWLDLLLSAVVEPHLGEGELLFLTHYPASQAALARLSAEDPRVAERFELFYRGVELANGFHELAEAREQRERFVAENRRRLELGLGAMPLDERLLAALEHGLPDCSGVALCLDRLVMLALGCASLDEVVAFPCERA